MFVACAMPGHRANGPSAPVQIISYLQRAQYPSIVSFYLMKGALTNVVRGSLLVRCFLITVISVLPRGNSLANGDFYAFFNAKSFVVGRLAVQWIERL